MGRGDVIFSLDVQVTDVELNGLFSAAWPEHIPTDFQTILSHSLHWVCAYSGMRLIGFVNLAWDGGAHAFLLDPTVHPDFRRQGIGTCLVRMVIAEARNNRIEWIHVDFEPLLEKFYSDCGFTPTMAGLLRMTSEFSSNPE